MLKGGREDSILFKNNQKKVTPDPRRGYKNIPSWDINGRIDRVKRMFTRKDGLNY
jgi:hypothetical protein